MWQYVLKEKPGNVAKHPHHMLGQFNLPRSQKILMNNLEELGRGLIKFVFGFHFFCSSFLTLFTGTSISTLNWNKNIANHLIQEGTTSGPRRRSNINFEKHIWHEFGPQDTKVQCGRRTKIVAHLTSSNFSDCDPENDCQLMLYERTTDHSYMANDRSMILVLTCFKMILQNGTSWIDTASNTYGDCTLFGPLKSK
jgi:hypothetical protein